MRGSWKTLIVDLDGTLVDFAQRHYRCFIESAGVSQDYHPLLTPEHYWQLKRDGLSSTAILEAHQIKVDAQRFSRNWATQIESESKLALDTLLPFAADFLRTASSTGANVILATKRRNPAGLEIQLGRLGISRHLTQIIQCDPAAPKHASVMATAVLSAPSAETLWIGDSEDDWEGAKVLGCHVRLVTTGIRSRDYLGKLAPGMVIDSLEQVAFQS